MEEAVPASVIAQAEAAVAANIEDDEVAPPRRRRSTAQTTAQSFFSLLQDTIQDNIDNRNLKRSDTQASQLSNMGILLEPFKNPDRLDASQEGFATKAKVTDDGRVKIDIKEKANKLSNLLTPALKTQLDAADQEPLPPGYIPEALGGKPGQTPPPRLNVVIQVVGSRGDVQPFIALGKVLKSTYGHRVRLATHPTFQSFVEENGLEFFSIGGDPEELMAFMVKNPGLMPGMDALKSGEIGKRRKGMEQTILGCWRSCIEAGDGLGAPSRNSSSSSASASIMEHLGMDSGINMDTSPAARPFIADAIIANPPSFAHIHIAERLGIPLHIMFT